MLYMLRNPLATGLPLEPYGGDAAALRREHAWAAPRCNARSRSTCGNLSHGVQQGYIEW
jgi:hypothetical protein